MPDSPLAQKKFLTRSLYMLVSLVRYTTIDLQAFGTSFLLSYKILATIVLFSLLKASIILTLILLFLSSTTICLTLSTLIRQSLLYSIQVLTLIFVSAILLTNQCLALSQQAILIQYIFFGSTVIAWHYQFVQLFIAQISLLTAALIVPTNILLLLLFSALEVSTIQ